MKSSLVASVFAAFTALGTFARAAEVPFSNGYPQTDRSRIYELKEVKRGDRGVGYTVFSGSEVKPFQVEVLGVMDSLIGPEQDIILARLSGPEIEFTGVISGMSGSPVFIDGRLVGAVSYRIGQFTREPIAGITPIRSMLALYSDDVGPPALKPPSYARLGPDRAKSISLADFRALTPDLDPWPVPARNQSGPLRPIDTPIAVSGLDPQSLEQLRTRLAPAGLQVVAGGASGHAVTRFSVRNPSDRRVQANRKDRAGTVAAAPIAPAAPVAIVLMRGAVNASALCTVTMVERNRVYGCGHSFLGSGHVKFPMATAAILNTLASEAGSFKQSSAAREVGVIDQDRLTAVAGRIGRAAPMVPLRVSVRRADQPPKAATVSDVEIVDSPIWLPMMADSLISSAVNRRLGFEAGGTLQLRVRITVGRRKLEFSDTFSVPPPLPLGGFAARDVSSAVGLLMQNNLARATVRGIEVEAIVDPNISLAQIQRVTPDRAWVRPGDRLGLTVELKPYRQAPRQTSLEVPIPVTADGPIKIMVGGSLELDRRDVAARRGRAPVNVDDLIDMLAERRPARRLTARVYLPKPGLRTYDTVLPGLPPTMQATLTARRAEATAILEEAPGPEVSRPDPDVIVGGVEVSIEVRP